MRPKIFFTCTILCVAFLAPAQQKPSQQWLDQKFSMFIHFGLYSVYGGVYDGKPVERGYSEQIQSFAGIFSDWYAQTAQKFNPVKWNPDSIVALAKEAGMRSVVFTSKHHDGFCMYHSQYTDFNIVDATPYGRDLLKELADACRRGGIGFSVYFSLIDWNFPQAYPISSHNADPLTEEHYRFNLKQVEEIMTRYGAISEIWFDMGSLTPAQSKGLYELVNRLQPQCMISGRLGNDYVDFAVMGDNEYPDYKLGVPWQTAASIFDETWGYRSWQQRGDVRPKTDEKIASLIRVISRGGNYLLNIGPRGDGSVVQFERDVLLRMGEWIKTNADAIYATKANPLQKTFDWGSVTTKGNNLYAFVEKMPEDRKIRLSGFTGKVSDITILSSAQSLPFVQEREGVTVTLPPPHENGIPVLKVAFDSGFSVVPSILVTKSPLTAQNATPVFGHSSLNYYGGYKSLLEYDWRVKSNKSNPSPTLFFTENEKGRKAQLEVNGQQQTITLNPERAERVRTAKNSVNWGKLYRKPGRGVFGWVEEENGGLTNPADEQAGWKEVAAFAYGQLQQQKLSQRGSILFLQEIDSDREQDIAVEIGSGNAAYVLLNGEYVTAHFSPERIAYQKEIVILPLKKGKNQLVVKFYNGFEKTLQYSLKPLQEWTVYRQKLPPVRFRKNGCQQISIRDANPASRVAPLRMSNLRMEF